MHLLNTLPVQRFPTRIDVFLPCFLHSEQLYFSSKNIDFVTYYVFLKQWVPREASGSITHATYSCDSQSIYVSFEDGSVGVLTASTLRFRCRINPTAYLPPNPRYNTFFSELFKNHNDMNALFLLPPLFFLIFFLFFFFPFLPSMYL